MRTELSVNTPTPALVRRNKYEEVSPEYLREHLNYDPATGVVTSKKTGKRLGSIHVLPVGSKLNVIAGKQYFRQKEYRSRSITIKGFVFKEARVIYAWMTGAWPVDEIDHENHDGTDNRWDNIRPSSSSQNKINRRRPIHNTSGVKGVSRTKSGKFAARIQYNRNLKHLGTFDTIEEAAEAYRQASTALAGEFAQFD